MSEKDPIHEALEQADSLGHASMLVTFDAESQSLGLKFDPKLFKTWDFVSALLHMAQKQAETMGEMTRMAAMQQQAMNHQQAQQLGQQIFRGRH